MKNSTEKLIIFIICAIFFLSTLGFITINKDRVTDSSSPMLIK